jgi:hypothetical protein
MMTTMKSSVTALFLAVLLALPLALAAAVVKVDDKPMFPDPIDPSGVLTITGSGFTGPLTGSLFDLSQKETKLDSGIVVSDKTVTFRLPPGIAPGRYVLRVSIGDLQDYYVPGEVRIGRPEPKLESAYPTTAYRDDTGGFTFALNGQNLPKDPADVAVVVDGVGNIIPASAAAVAAKPCAERVKGDPLPCVTIDDPGRRIVVRGYSPQARAYQGPISVRVRDGDTLSNPTKVVLARMSAAGVLIATVVLFGALAYTIYSLVARGMKGTMIHGVRYSPLHAFFLDGQTQTYSLSKFQLFAFSFTFIFGYLYVLLCRWLVQWLFVLPDVPSNLAAMLAISGGTTLIAAGATQTRGSKGSGELYPSVADFVSVGGQVVPERFQYFVWTLIACFGFLALLLSKDPAAIDGFPTFPDGLLYVMGVSAATYVGGKVTRSPGPIIKNIAVTRDRNPIVIVQGENLSRDADFFLDDKKLPIVTKDELAASGIDRAKQPSLVIGTTQAGASDRSFCTELQITIVEEQAGVTLGPGDHRFRVVNRDAQFAETPFSIPDMKIAMVTNSAGGPVRAQTTDVVLEVTGSAFSEPLAADWTPAGATSAEPLKVERLSDSKLHVTVNTGPAGTARLKISAPSGSTSVDVKVE